MSLSPSCDGLYFPAEPRDNIVTLKWNNSNTPLEPNTSVIFKVKCTAPQLFHVVPRYGAILLADATGSAVQYSNKSTEITFGLRENHAGAEEKNGGDAGNGAELNSMNRASVARASRATSAAPGGPAYQERFAVEYVMIKSEPLAFQQILNSLADQGKLMEVVKSMWSLVASSAIPRAHLGVQASINIKVHMENVVLNRNDPAPNGGDEATKILVPMEARLVSPKSHDRQSRPNGRNPSAATSHKTSENPSMTNSTPTSSRRKAVDELRALKEEINLMRLDSSTSPNGSPPNLTSPSTTNTPSPQKVSEGKRPANSLTPPQNSSIAASLATAEGEDVVMKFGDESGGVGNNKGLKVYVVLVIMFVLYIFLLFMRREAKHTVEVTATDTDGKHNAFAVQLSSKELKTSTL